MDFSSSRLWLLETLLREGTNRRKFSTLEENIYTIAQAVSSSRIRFVMRPRPSRRLLPFHSFLYLHIYITVSRIIIIIARCRLLSSITRAEWDIADECSPTLSAFYCRNCRKKLVEEKKTDRKEGNEKKKPACERSKRFWSTKYMIL